MFRIVRVETFRFVSITVAVAAMAIVGLAIVGLVVAIEICRNDKMEFQLANHLPQFPVTSAVRQQTITGTTYFGSSKNNGSGYI